MATKPKLALIPSGYKASKVYSVLPADGVGDFDFSRSGDATRINKDGLIETVDSNVPRLNYPLIDGVVSGCPSLLLEPQSTNLLQYSESFDNAYWIKVGSSVVGGFTSPKGDLSAFKLVEDTSNGQHFTEVSSLSILNTTKHTISFYVKYNGVQFIRIFGSGLNANTYFDVLNGAIGSTTAESNKIELLSNGWYRCTMIDESISTSTSFKISLAESDGVVVYTGDGTSSVYIYGAQAEQQSYPTSYIPNYGTALGVTRAAETCNGAGDASTFNDSEGVLFAEISALTKDGGESRRITISDGSTNNRVSIELDETEDLLKLFQSGNGTLSQLTANLDVSETFKILASYNSNRLKLYINGFLVSQDLSIVLPIGLNNLSFDSGTSASDFYGNTKQLQYFDTALNDTDLETLTSWTSFNEMAESQQYTIL